MAFEGLGKRPTMACSKFTGGSSECTRPFLLIKTQLALYHGSAGCCLSLSFVYLWANYTGSKFITEGFSKLSECGSKFITEGFSKRDKCKQNGSLYSPTIFRATIMTSARIVLRLTENHNSTKFKGRTSIVLANYTDAIIRMWI